MLLPCGTHGDSHRSLRPHKLEGMSNNNNSLCESHARKDFHIKQTLWALCVCMLLDKLFLKTRPEPGLHANYNAGIWLPCLLPFVFFFLLSLPSFISTFHRAALYFLTSWGRMFIPDGEYPPLGFHNIVEPWTSTCRFQNLPPSLVWHLYSLYRSPLWTLELLIIFFPLEDNVHIQPPLCSTNTTFLWHKMGSN